MPLQIRMNQPGGGGVKNVNGETWTKTLPVEMETFQGGLVVSQDDCLKKDIWLPKKV